MQSLKLITLFIKNHLVQLGRKWISLPLLLLSPILLIGLLAFSLLSLTDIVESETIEVGLVNLDQSEETELIVNLLAESSQLGEGLHMKQVTEAEGIEGIENDQLNSYIIFPADFFQALLDGQRSQVSIIGNPDRPLESQLVNELIETITRHIRGSQANILTVNDYAKELDMDSEARNDLLFDQFIDFFFYVLGSNQVVNEQEITNHATASPLHYFSLAGWYTLVTIWLFTVYTQLHRNHDQRMKARMQLYGVTEFQQAIATIVVTLLITVVMSAFTFSGLLYFLEDLTLVSENYVRIALLTLLHSIIFLQCLLLLDWLVPSQKLTLLVHTLFTGLVIIFSGAIVPMIYFPAYLEQLFQFSFAHQAFYWIEQISLNGRFYAEYQALALTMLAGFALLGVISIVKGRMQP